MAVIDGLPKSLLQVCEIELIPGQTPVIGEAGPVGSFRRPTARYQATWTTIPVRMDGDNFLTIEQFIRDVDTYQNTVRLTDYRRQKRVSHFAPLSATPTVAASAVAGTTLDVNSSELETLILRAGARIGVDLGTHHRLYEVMADATTGLGGDASISLRTPMREDPVDDSDLLLFQADFRLMEPPSINPISNGNARQYTFRFEEPV